MEIKIDPNHDPKIRFKRVTFVEGDEEVGKIDLEETGNRICLWSFVIFEQFRQKGFGSAAMQELVNYLKGKKLWLYVWRDNTPALKIYKKVGFKITNDNTPGSSYDMIYE